MEETFCGGSQLLTIIGVPADDFIRTKNTREFSPRVFRIVERQLRLRSPCRRGRGTRRGFRSQSCGATRLVEHGDHVVRKIDIVM